MFDAAHLIRRLAQRIARKYDRNLHHQIQVVGRHSYGTENINLISFSDQYSLKIGSFCSIAGKITVLLGGDHRTDWATTYPFGHINQDLFPEGSIHGALGHPVSKGDVILQDDVWIGYGATILSGVTLGSGCCIGARAVVTKSIPPYAIAVGNPAKIIRYRFDDETIALLLQAAWWQLPDIVINELIPLLQVPCSTNIARLIQQKCLDYRQSISNTHESLI